MQPPELFPKIPYTRQLGRLHELDARGEPIPYNAEEVAFIRASLLNRGWEKRCPRCHEVLDVKGPVKHPESGTPIWRVRCETCRLRLTVSPRAVASQRDLSSAGLVHYQPVASPLRNRAPHGVIAVAVHAAAIIAAIVFTLPPTEDPSGRADTTTVFLTFPRRDVEPELVRLAPELLESISSIQGFQTIAAPVEIPDGLDFDDPPTRIDPRDFSGIGQEGATFAGAVGDAIDGEERGPNYIWASAAQLDEAPELISSPPLEYPRRLRDRSIEGHVTIRFVIDTLGLAEQQTIEIVEASHEGFIESAKNIVRNSRYRPGQVRGRPVRVWSVITINFTLTE
jgi:TonB family protein